jgi:transcriptional regulator of acetoin/glycerol metabolism
MQDRSIRALEGQLVTRVLDDTSWNISKAAAILGINRTTLYNKIRLHNLGRRPNRTKVSVS